MPLGRTSTRPLSASRPLASEIAARTAGAVATTVAAPRTGTLMSCWGSGS